MKKIDLSFCLLTAVILAGTFVALTSPAPAAKTAAPGPVAVTITPTSAGG